MSALHRWDGTRVIIIITIIVVFGSFENSLSREAETLQITYDNEWIEYQDLSKYLQPDDLLSGKYNFADPGDYLCARDCDSFPESRLCYYKFVAEHYSAMSPACDGCPEDWNACFKPQCIPADGIERTVLTINRRLCSPAIMICRGDRVVVDVINQMPSKQLTIHWHGMRMKETPFYDGVAFLTQCPIGSGQTFRYNYVVKQQGDFFFHSHEFPQMYDGIEGPFIVRTEKQLDPNSDLYDEDLFSHVLFVQDWVHLLFEDKIPGYNNDTTKSSILAETFLINGHGTFVRPDGSETVTPRTVYEVEEGKSYRFRLIGASNSPVIVTFEDHDFTLISVDEDAVKPTTGGSVFISAGERYSVVIKANREPKSYWIQVLAVIEPKAVQYAILRYVNEDGSPVSNEYFPSIPRPFAPRTPIFNDVRADCNPDNADAICIDQVVSLIRLPGNQRDREPDYRLFLKPGFHIFKSEELYVEGLYMTYSIPFIGPSKGGGMFADVYNQISSGLTPTPLLTQDDPLPKNLRCSKKCRTGETYCDCLAIYKIPLNSLVDIIIIDDTQVGVFYHSHHLHGTSFRVVKQGGPREMQNNPNFYRDIFPSDYLLYPLRDTVTVPLRGFAVLRFYADNPGMWLLHCHVSAHNYFGMKIIVQIGERYQFVKPPDGFPTCHDFVPNVRRIDMP